MGNGMLAQQISPAPVPGVAGATALDIEGGRRTCARFATGDVSCWGEAPFGIRNKSPPMMIDPPTTVPELATATAFSTASDHTCAVMPDHSLVCAGQNDHGQLGDGTTTAHFAFMPAMLPCP
jgi:hypothetical protein